MDAALARLTIQGKVITLTQPEAIVVLITSSHGRACLSMRGVVSTTSPNHTPSVHFKSHRSAAGWCWSSSAQRCPPKQSSRAQMPPRLLAWIPSCNSCGEPSGRVWCCQTCGGQ